MKRDPALLAGREFDLIVVGGGVYGLCTAWDAAQRGLSVALVEQGDFAGATSSNSLKIAHGGLRYLQQADFSRMRLSIRERRTLLGIAPHLVKPLACVMPTTRKLTRRRTVLRCALFANDLVGCDRNKGLPPTHHLPPGRILSKAECLERIPGLGPGRLTGGALWYDAQMRNTERLALGYLHRAVEHGAVAANYVAARGLLMDGTRVAGVRVEDTIAGERFDVRGSVVVNAAGPWFAQVAGAVPPGLERIRLSRTMNLVTRPVVRDHAVGVGVEGGRLFFLVPWRGWNLVGTTHRPYDGEPGAYHVSEREVEQFLRWFAEAYPAAGLKRDDVRFFHGGLLPSLGTDARGDAVLLKHHRIVDHGRRGGPDGLVTVLGVKWTTARAVAEQTVDRVFRRLGRTPPPCRTAELAVRGGEPADPAALEAAIRERTGVDAEAARALAGNHGPAWKELAPLIEEAPGRVHPDTEVLAAEVLFGMRSEMALTLCDLVFRRTELCSAGLPSEAALEACARLAAREGRWGEARTKTELDSVHARLRPAG